MFFAQGLRFYFHSDIGLIQLKQATSGCALRFFLENICFVQNIFCGVSKIGHGV